MPNFDLGKDIEDSRCHFPVVVRLVRDNSKVCLFLVAEKRAFNGVNIRDVEYVIEDFPCSQIITPSVSVGVIVESLILFADHHGEYLDLGA